MFRPVQEEEEEEEEEEGVVSPVLLLCNRPSERLSVSLSATCTGRLLDEVVFLSPPRPHSVEVAGGAARTSLLAHRWTRLGWVPRLSRLLL